MEKKMQQQALVGIRVVDFGQYLAGPLAAMMLADSGADVIRVDPPGGPRWDTPANVMLQRGKRSIVLDLMDADDLEVARDLVRSADVVVENFRPGVMARLGLGPEAMLETNPRLVYCSIPGFGSDDPRAGVAAWEGVIAAATGLYTPGIVAFSKLDAPAFNPVALASSFGGIIATHAIVAALIARERNGAGQQIEVPLHDAAFQTIGSYAQVPADSHPMEAINWAYIGQHRCADGRWVDVSPPLRGIENFIEHVVPSDKRGTGLYELYNSDAKAFAATTTLLEEVFSTRTAAEWERLGQDEFGLGIAVCQETPDWLRDQHALDTGCVIELDDPELGATVQAGFGVTMSVTPLVARRRHVLDADRAQILAELASLAELATAPAPAVPASGAGPLAGVKVVDATQILAGPISARVLAEYGAEVIKINNPDNSNPAAGTGHLFVNSGKRTILVNLRQPEGLELVHRLVADADVFSENFVQGTAERLGIGEAQLREVRPDLVYSSVSAHARGGYRGHHRGHEELGQAVTGMEMRYGDDHPRRQGFPVCDFGTGHITALGIVLALFHRLRTGEGQSVQAALSRSATMLQAQYMVAYESREWTEPRGVERPGEGPLYRLYRTADRLIFLAALKEGDRVRLTSVDGLHGVDKLSDADLETFLTERLAADTADAWVTRLQEAGIGAHELREVEENMLDPLTDSRRLSVLREHNARGSVRSVGRWGRFSATPLQEPFPASPLGWHTREIAKELGYGERLGELLERGALATVLREPSRGRTTSAPVTCA